MATPTHRDVIAVVASAGGVGALSDLLSRLPADLPACVAVLLHVPPYGGRALARVLQRACDLEVGYAEDRVRREHGKVHIAPPNRHLLVEADMLRLSSGPRQNGFRPAADALLFSAALGAGPRTSAVVLSGSLDDGAAGCAAVRGHGGLVLVQDPAEAAFAGMPSAALDAVPDAVTAPVAELAARLELEAREGTRETHEPRADPELERRVAWLMPGSEAEDVLTDGTPGAMSCPACGGPIHVSGPTPSEPGRFECVVGHAWTGRTLLDGQTGQVGWALELAARQLRERQRLTRRLADEAAGRGHHVSAERFAGASEQTGRALETITKLIAEVGDQMGGVSDADERDRNHDRNHDRRP